MPKQTSLTDTVFTQLSNLEKPISNFYDDGHGNPTIGVGYTRWSRVSTQVGGAAGRQGALQGGRDRADRPST
jgi:hypothetical protein